MNNESGFWNLNRHLRAWRIAVYLLPLFHASADAQFAPPTAISPTLAITRSSNSAIASWLVSPFDFLLESTNRLSGSGAWQGVSAPPEYVDDEVRVTVSTTNAQEFFRLRKADMGAIAGATVALFQFGIFYALDLEIAPDWSNMVTGPVHCNSNIFIKPESSLAFQSSVTAAGTISETNSPLDSTVRSPGTVVYQGGRRSGTVRLELPIGTNNTAATLREILEMPPAAEDPASDLGRQRFYNKADMIIEVNDSRVTVTSGIINNRATVIGSGHYNKFLSTNLTFFDQRENKRVRCIQLDLSNLRS